MKPPGDRGTARDDGALPASFKVAFARAMREGGIARIADEWLAREEAAAAATEEEVPLSNRLDALEAKLDALLARTSSG